MEESYLGLDIGFTNIKTALGSQKELISGVKSVPTEEWWSPEELTELVENTLQNFDKEPEELDAIGIGVPGLVDVTEKEMIYALQMEEIGFQELEEDLNTPVYIENDANAAVLGEKYYGDGRNYQDLVTIMMGSGVGGGVYRNGTFLGSREDGRSPEPGAVTVDGSSTWEDVMGGESIPDYVEDLLSKEDRRTELTTSISSEELFMASQHDAVAEDYLNELSTLNARGIANIVNLYAPELITFAGSVAKNNPEFMEESFRKTDDYLINPSPEMKLSDLEDLGVYGSLAIAANSK